MNIFVLDKDPVKAAEYHNDKHCIKMIVETAQLLSTAYFINDPIQLEILKQTYGEVVLYKPTHINHPCSVWVRQSRENFNWLTQLGLALCSEYTKRYGKIHKTQEILEFIQVNPLTRFPKEGLTQHPQCMPDYCRNDNPDGAVTAYRKYYICEKKDFSKWKTQVPEWFKVLE